jgi:acid phosphatase (class A)
LILAEIAPERRAALIQRGREIGWDRVIAGAHYYSDVVAGRVFGQALWESLRASPQFQQELAKAKAEFDAARCRQGAQP